MIDTDYDIMRAELAGEYAKADALIREQREIQEAAEARLTAQYGPTRNLRKSPCREC